MFERQLPDRPNLEQYKKQAKELARECALRVPDALARLAKNHPRFHKLAEAELRSAAVALADAQLVLAREHGFESWPKFASHIETLTIIRSLEEMTDPVAAFIEVACVPRHTGHGEGTLEHAEMILARYPQVATSNIHTAAILGDEPTVRRLLAEDAKNATAEGGPHGWNALTHLCFSRYLRIDKQRSGALVATAKALLDAGATANTGWYETIDYPEDPKQIIESAIYGVAGVARHPELARLLLERGADPNDGETPYHVPETYDNTVVKVLLESGKMTPASLAVMLVRKADWHDEAGMRMVLEHGADPNLMTQFGDSALLHAIRRDNRMKMAVLLLNHGADPALTSKRDGRSGVMIAARRGRGDLLRLFEERGIAVSTQGLEGLIAACAKADREAIRLLYETEPSLVREVIAEGGTLLAQFAGTGNVEGMRCLLDLGVGADAVHLEGDNYFDTSKGSTALHVAAWRAWPECVKELITRGAPVNALDAKGRTALVLACKACVDSYWTERRSPESVEALLKAGATVAGVAFPIGYAEVDGLLRKYA